MRVRFNTRYLWIELTVSCGLHWIWYGMSEWEELNAPPNTIGHFGGEFGKMDSCQTLMETPSNNGWMSKYSCWWRVYDIDISYFAIVSSRLMSFSFSRDKSCCSRRPRSRAWCNSEFSDLVQTSAFQISESIKSLVKQQILMSTTRPELSTVY